jgi:hypothetical protein
LELPCLTGYAKVDRFCRNEYLFRVHIYALPSVLKYGLLDLISDRPQPFPQFR